MDYHATFVIGNGYHCSCCRSTFIDKVVVVADSEEDAQKQLEEMLLDKKKHNEDNSDVYLDSVSIWPDARTKHTLDWEYEKIDDRAKDAYEKFLERKSELKRMAMIQEFINEARRTLTPEYRAETENNIAVWTGQIEGIKKKLENYV
jgi:hypothetical protein